MLGIDRRRNDARTFPPDQWGRKSCQRGDPDHGDAGGQTNGAASGYTDPDSGE
jgi:hypothetical protein